MASANFSWPEKVSALTLIWALAATLFLALPSRAEIIREDNSSLQSEAGVPLYFWHDTSQAEPLAVCIIVHGSAQQAGVMNVLATSLAEVGYFVIAPDIRGHGRRQSEEQAQLSVHEALFDSAQDVVKIMQVVREKYPNTNIFCLGESIGVGVVLHAVAESPKRVRGLILCSAGIQPHFHNPLNLGSKFVFGMARLVQPVDISDYLTRYSSDDTRIAQEMVSDPLGRNKQTGMELLGTFNFLTQEPDFAASLPEQVRVLVLQGDRDQILEPNSAYRVFSALKGKRKKFVMIPGAGHVLIGTSFIKPAVFEAIRSWLTENNRH